MTDKDVYAKTRKPRIEKTNKDLVLTVGLKKALEKDNLFTVSVLSKYLSASRQALEKREGAGLSDLKITIKSIELVTTVTEFKK